MPRAIQTEGFQADTLSFLERIIYRWAEIDKSLQLEIAGINASKKIRSKLFASSPEGLKDAVMAAKKWNAEHFNIYFCPNPVRGNVAFANGKRPSDKDIAAAFYVFADADTISASAAIMEGQDFCFRVITGTVPFLRLHGYLELDQPIIFIDDQTGEQSAKALENWRTKQQIIINRFKTDPAIKNPSRLMRLPGFIAFAKNQTRIAEKVNWEGVNDTRVSADFFNNAKENIPLALDYNSRKLRDIFDLESSGRSDADINSMLLASRQTGHWHNNVLRVVASLVGRGWSDQEIAQKCAPFCDHGATDRDLIEMIDRARAKGWGQTKATSDIKTKNPVTEGFRFPLVRASDLVTKEPDFLIDGMLETESLALVFGESGCGKSFLAIDIAACVATGTPFHGRLTKKGTVIFIAGEGHNGLRRRLSAWEAHKAASINGASLFISKTAAQILDQQSALSVEAAVDEISSYEGKPVLLVVDTVARNFGPGDENATQDMGRFIAALDRIKARYACTVLLIHHTGHSDKSRARGATALKAALDTELKAEKHGANIILKNTKTKEAPLSDDLAFELVPVDVGITSTGEVIQSAALALTQLKAAVKANKATPSEIFALINFREACFEHGRLDENGNFAGIYLEDWREFYYSRSTLDNVASKNTAFNRARRRLQERGEISVIADMYFPAGPDAIKLREQFNQALQSKRL